MPCHAPHCFTEQSQSISWPCNAVAQRCRADHCRRCAWPCYAVAVPRLALPIPCAEIHRPAAALRDHDLPTRCYVVPSRRWSELFIAVAVRSRTKPLRRFGELSPRWSTLCVRCPADAEPPDALPQPSHAMLILCGSLRRYECRAMPPQRISSRNFAMAVPCFAEQSHCDSEQRPCGAYPVHAVAMQVASVLCRRGANLGRGRASLSRCGCDRSRALPCRSGTLACRASAQPCCALRAIAEPCRPCTSLAARFFAKPCRSSAPPN